MSMTLKYGTYSFNAGATKIAFRTEALLNQGGQYYANKHMWDVEGYLNCDSASDCTLKMNALETAMLKPFQDLVFYEPDGVTVAAHLRNNTSITGVRIKGPNWLEQQGAAWVTFQKFAFTAEAEYPLGNVDNLLLSFTETVRFSGGGPIRKHRRALNAPPQRQLIYKFTEFSAVQEGEAVGYVRYPIPPKPIWPQHLMKSPDMGLTTPTRVGDEARLKKGKQGYKSTWNYYFESVTQLAGTPTIWLS